MRTVAASAICLGLLFSVPAFADDNKSVDNKSVEAPTSQPADSVKLPEGVPQNFEEAMEAAKEGVSFAKAKNWWGLSAVIIFVLMFVLKVVGVFKKIGKRWAYILVPGLSAVAMLLSKFAGDLSWGAAIAVLTSGPFMALASDFVKRGIMGKEHETTVKKYTPVDGMPGNTNG